MSLTPNKLWAYSREIDVLLAEEQLRSINASNFPTLNEKNKRRMIRQYKKICDPYFKEKQQNQAAATMKALQGKFGFKGKR